MQPTRTSDGPDQKLGRLAVNRNRLKINAKLAYEHIRSGGSYVSFKDYGFVDRVEMYRSVVQYCRNNELELPKTSECRRESIGAEAYRLKMSGLPWRKVGDVLSVCPTAARKKALQYQEAHSLPEMPNIQGQRARLMRGEPAYKDKADSGDPWGDVAIRHGFNSKQAVYDAARRYANHANLPFPPMEATCAS